MKQTTITKDAAKKQLTVIREFDAPLDQVWKAWTQSDILDQWWAPRPWKAKTKSMDFREGGTWMYAMLGPAGEESWARADFKSVNAPNSFTMQDAFCDEHGNINTDFPRMQWRNEFSPTAGGTQVKVVITFNSEADLDKIVEMGFKEGFTAAHSNL